MNSARRFSRLFSIFVTDVCGLPEMESVTEARPASISAWFRMTEEARRKHADALMRKYPERFLVICHPPSMGAAPSRFGLGRGGGEAFQFIVPDKVTLQHIHMHLRKSLKMEAHQSLFLFVRDAAGRQQLPPSSTPLIQLHGNYAQNDRVLYIVYTLESTFG